MTEPNKRAYLGDMDNLLGVHREQVPPRPEPESPTARIARLTEMARGVWPDERDGGLFLRHSDTAARVDRTYAGLLIAVIHPRALDMLEAALRAALESNDDR